MASSGADAEYTFGNSEWTPTALQIAYAQKVFNQVDATITIYENDYFDDYKTWLDNGAYGQVTGVVPMTDNDLYGFQTKIDSYCAYSISYRV